MRSPWANTVLLVLLIAQLLTGAGGLISGSEQFRWVLWLHGIGAYAIVVLLVWKGRIIVDAVRRRPSLTPSRLGFLALTGLVLAILATGLIWTYGGRTYLFGMSLLVLHGFLASALIAFLLWHILAKRFIFRVPRARDRRAFLRLVGASVAGLALWRVAAPAREVLHLPGATRRFTGSYETGSLTGLFPETSWLLDYPAPVDLANWRLVVDGAVERPLALTYEQLAALADDTVTELLDCTGGWYSTQAWTGVKLARLLDMAGPTTSARSVTVQAISGYDRRFSLAEAPDYVLATQVAGERLSHGHGFPLRLVAPGHRGYAWVKWVAHIQVNETSELWQPPVPLQ